MVCETTLLCWRLVLRQSGCWMLCSLLFPANCSFLDHFSIQFSHCTGILSCPACTHSWIGICLLAWDFDRQISLQQGIKSHNAWATSFHCSPSGLPSWKVLAGSLIPIYISQCLFLNSSILAVSIIFLQCLLLIQVKTSQMSARDRKRVLR